MAMHALAIEPRTVKERAAMGREGIAFAPSFAAIAGVAKVDLVSDGPPNGHDGRCTLDLLIGAFPGGSKRQSGQCRERLRTGSLHDRGTMVFDGALADAEIRSDILTRVALQDHRHDLALSGGETRNMFGRCFPPL
jgi:hypothetical protein